MSNSDKVNEALNQKFLNKDSFSEEIEKLVLETNLNYIDAIVLYCERHDLDVESIGKLVSKPIKEKLRYDATELNYLKRTSRAKLPKF
mgnify:CR=1 FL=1